MIERIVTTEGEILHQAMPDTVCNAACQAARIAPAKGEGLDDDPQDALAPASLPPPIAPRAISAANAYIINDMMLDVIRRGTGTRARALGRDDLAGKTGTTNEQRDAWFCGYNAEHVAVAWVGFDDITPLGPRETGGHTALPMWMKYMQQALAGTPSRHLPQPADVVSARVNPESGLLADFGGGASKFEIFIQGRLPEMEFSGRSETSESGRPASRSDEVIEDIF